MGAPVTVLLRPYGARAGCAGEDHNHITGVVEDVFFRGDNFRVQVRPEGGPELSFLVDNALPLSQPVTLCLPPDAVLVLAEASAHVP